MGCGGASGLAIIHNMTKKVHILDNTLREGEQVPGVWFSYDEKFALFDALCAAGVDSIDLGIPATSQESMRFCADCVQRAGSTSVGVTIRAIEEEIDLAADLHAPEVFLMCPFSEIHIKHKFNTNVAEIKKRCTSLIKHAHARGLRVSFAAEDASRGSPELVAELSRHAAQEGLYCIYFCDTLGTLNPTRTGELVRNLCTAVKGLCRVGAHCHDDLGMATANTLAAVEAGAGTVSVTVNGLGERAGNAPLHEVAAALTFSLKRIHNITLDRLAELSSLAEVISGVFLSPLTPIVGRNAFRHESGIHVDGLLKDVRVYEELKPEIFGRSREIVIGNVSGVNYLRALLRERGLEADTETLRRLQSHLKENILSGSKQAIGRMVAVLNEYYREHSGMPIETFWALAGKHLTDKQDG